MCAMTETLEIALVGACAAIAGGLVYGAYQHCRDHLSRPKLEIDYAGTAANRIEITYKKTEGLDDAEVYIRARVKNIGRRTAKGAQVFLTSLKEVHPSGTTPTTFHDSMPLAWSGWKFTPRDIPPASNVHFFVDLMRVSKHDPGWLLSVEQLFSSQGSLKTYSGTYRFQLTVTARQCRTGNVRSRCDLCRELERPSCRSCTEAQIVIRSTSSSVISSFRLEDQAHGLYR
jgi:hypothetical protein